MKLQNLLPSLLLVSITTGCTAQIKNARTQMVHIDGSCGMCEKKIEGAALVKGEAMADWDRNTKLATITFDSTRTTGDAVLKRVSLAGYDNENYLAPDKAYADLDGCCQYDRNRKHEAIGADVGGHHDADAGHSDHAQADSTSAAHVDAPAQEPNEKTDQLKPLFDAYFAVKNALVASDANAAAARADELTTAWHSIHMERMGPELHGVWMNVMEPIEKGGHLIAASKDLDVQRKAFATLAAPMLALVKVAPRTAPVYSDHCPMYEGGADWLSLEKPIKNPFYGSMMLGCGSVKETIQ